MVLNPHVLQRAQEELDRVLGEGDLPTFDDRDKLPYVNALVHETMRWASVTPHGFVSSVIHIFISLLIRTIESHT